MTGSFWRQKVVVVTRAYEISCGHHLPNHEGKCRSPHGHNYLIEVSVQGELAKEGPSEGMVIDFADLDTAVKPILVVLDHQNLNQINDQGPYLRPDGSHFKILPMPPTAENICSWVFSEVMRKYPIYSSAGSAIQLRSIKVFETSDSWVEVTR